MTPDNQASQNLGLTFAHVGIAISELFFCSIAFCLNAFVVFLLLWKLKSTLKHSNAVFLLNLAIWDLSFSILLISMTIKKLNTNSVYSNHLECTVEAFLSSAFGYCSFVSIMLLSLDRYLKVVMRINLQLHMCVVLILAFTCVALGLSSIPFFFLGYDAFVLQPSGFYCLVNLKASGEFGSLTSVLVLAYYIMCFCTISICYISIIRTIYLVQKDLLRLPKLFPLTPDNEQSDSKPSSLTSARNTGSSLNVPQITSSGSGLIRTSGAVNRRNRANTTLSQRHRSIDAQLAIKSILIGCTHMVLYLLFGICAVCQIADVKNIEVLDIIAINMIFLCLILDPLWSILFDQKIREHMSELYSLCTKHVESSFAFSFSRYFSRENNTNNRKKEENGKKATAC